MSLLMTLRIALTALGRNKMRTALTMLGMIIGVAAVITMVALGTGAQRSIEQQISAAGTNLIIVNSGNWTVGGVRQGQGASTTLTVDDVDAIRREVAGVQYLAAGVNTRSQVVAGNQNWSTRVQGTDVDLPLMRSWPLRYGSFFGPQDVATAAKVAILGSVVSDNLFGADTDPTGQFIRIGSQVFRVSGVMASKGQAAMGDDQDDTIFVPYTTVQKKLLGIAHVNNITVSAESAEQTAQVARGISALLRTRHRLAPDEADDFMVRTLEEMASVRSETARTMTALLASIAGVSLLVGGIGIMNIMLVSVTERTREIGIRLAVGARRRDVLLQFLVEAMVLSLLGGLVGIALGYAASRAIAQSPLGWPTAVSADAVSLAFGFAAATGVFFGFYPARKASALHPIDALRYE
jgi:putative ABC transport system permease protein